MSTVESFLNADERVLWEGSPRGWPPLRRALALYALAFVAYATIVALVVRSALAGYSAGQFNMGAGFIEVVRWNGPKGALPPLGASFLWLPSPLFMFALFGSIELVRLSRWRARRYAITDRRAFVLEGTVVRPIARETITSASVASVFAGVADPEAALAALRP